MIWGLSVVTCLLLAGPAVAQDLGAGAAGLPAADTIPDEAPVPRGAFVRALLLPGWGHAYIDEPARGAVFFALQSGSWYMLLKTLSRLGSASGVENRLEGFGRDSLNAAMEADTALARELSDPFAYDEALMQYRGLADARGLVEAREQQRQDWVVYTLVLPLASAVDAYVTAHLKDFPADLTATPTADGGTAIGLQVPIGGGR
ncbi:MAG: hypothetical protein WD054_01325 [Gemmatimonadota bacterium]